MNQLSRAAAGWTGAVGLCFFSFGAACGGQDGPETQKQLRQVQQQNESLQEQLRQQQQLIEELNRKVSALETATREGARTQDPAQEQGAAGGATRGGGGSAFGKVHIGGEGAVGLFHSQADGRFPNTEFVVDEAKVFLEAPILSDVYFFSEVNFFTREASSANVRVGELYLDVENISRLWDQDRQLNLRAGRIDIPFGEEYRSRDAIANPLISHSLMDLWGVDEGLELYGAVGKVQYVLAVQNGGHDALRDFHRDKAVVARVGLDPATWLHCSVSAMRTGELDVDEDETSELWLGSGFVRSLGSPATTVFQADLVQGDVQLKFPTTTFKAAGGVLQYDDDDPAADNQREVYHYYVEATQKVYRGFYAAARWSQVFAADGFPVAGIGDVEEYYENVLTERLWLLSLGAGYRWSDQLVLKLEYSFTRGREAGGATRGSEDMFGVQVAFAF